jgi:hypothetical protein
MHLSTSFLLTCQLINQEKTLQQEQQEVLFLPSNWLHWYDLSESELLSLLDQIREDFANGTLSTHQYLNVKKLLADRIQQMRRANL